MHKGFNISQDSAQDVTVNLLWRMLLDKRHTSLQAGVKLFTKVREWMKIGRICTEKFLPSADLSSIRDNALLYRNPLKINVRCNKGPFGLPIPAPSLEAKPI
jgi:hypothetical protein